MVNKGGKIMLSLFWVGLLIIAAVFVAEVFVLWRGLEE
jgi:hypothetical protein